MKNLFLIFSILFSTLSWSQTDQVTVSSVPDKDALDSMEMHYGGSSGPVNIGDGMTVVGKRMSPYGFISFSFTAQGSRGGERTYNFDLPERARQAMCLRITDDTKSSDGLSARLLETSLYFFPRRAIPTVEGLGEIMEVTLPTGEKVQFDRFSKAIKGGVLSEKAPLDLTADRSKRKFAQLGYEGEGIVIRVDRRAGVPETIYKTPYNVNEDIKNAVVTFRGQTCKIPKELLWDQNDSRSYYFLYPTDEELYEKVLKPRCGWSDLPL